MSAVVASFDSDFFWKTLFGTTFIEPFLLVLLITVVAQTAGTILGFPLALGRISRNRLVRLPVNFYLFLFRGTPLLLQILFVYDGLAEVTGNPAVLYPITRNAIIAGILTLSLNEAAYMAEIIRAGLQAVDSGQVDAAKALGMSRGQYMRRIIVPQSLRVIVPPLTNEYINMSKSTALLSTIAVGELLYQAQAYFSVNFRVFESLSVAAVWYLVLYTFLVTIQTVIESRFGERQDTGGGPGLARRLLSGGRGPRQAATVAALPAEELELPAKSPSSR